MTWSDLQKTSFLFTFTTLGSYEYFCSLHPHITSAVMVAAVTASSGVR